VQRPRDDFSPDRLAAALALMPSMNGYRVALSGGADSVALLHALCCLREALAPAQISAIHVHHGLHHQADSWEMLCQRLCADLQVTLDVLRIDAGAGRGESPEAAARRARYQALQARLGAGAALCTAHHQRDQAETVLLQLLRGAGPAGLAGMPVLAPFGKGWLARPLLDTKPQALREYLVHHQLPWAEDPANTDQRFHRNYLRHAILPRLEERWPGAQRTLARAARHQADSAENLQALAGMDLAAARGSLPGTLSVCAVQRLPVARARNLLRGWLAERGLPAAGAAHVQRILSELVNARRDATPLICWPGAQVRRYRLALHASAPLPAHDPTRVIGWKPGTPLALDYGRLLAISAEGRGLSVDRCADARVEVRFRQGGERFQPAGRRHSSALKKLLQSTGVPPWLRERLPLIYVDGELAAVAGLWVGEAYAVDAGGSGWLLSWSELPGTADGNLLSPERVE
jgi:tRNA(Ile)-lysidine synthase